MYVRGEGKGVAFDAVVAVEGQFKFRPSIDKVPTIEVLLCHTNSRTGTTYGTCPFTTLSPKTLEAFLNFLKCVEQDYGEVLFEGGVITPFGPAPATGKAESGKGLPTGLGEG
jgi:hypothetical protein